jgi:ATPase subunit of ABC transporter with duplicated ATPase domains
VRVVGPNGAGKSTLLHALLKGTEQNGDLCYLPQEIDVETSTQLLRSLRELPGTQLGQLIGIVSRLGSDPGRLLETETPSPGETRKLLLAQGILGNACAFIMDEPTNHLDLDSIEHLEAALSDCPGALLLVSHDREFLDRTTEIEWRVEPDAKTGESVVRCL